MSSESYAQEINVSNILTLNFTYIQEKLRKNFEIIAKRLSKLEGLFGVEQKMKGIEREAKFLSMKLDNVIMKIPEISMGVSPQTVKIICDEQMVEYMNSSHDNLKSTRFYHEVKDAVTRGLREETKLPPPVSVPVTFKKKDKNQKNEKVQKFDYDVQRVPLRNKINRDEVTKDMTKEEVYFTDKILKEEKSAEELVLEVAMRMRIFIRDYEQTRISKGTLEFVNKSLDKYDQFESYESKFSNKKFAVEKDKTKTRIQIQRGKDNPEEYERKQMESLEKERREDKTATKVEKEKETAREAVREKEREKDRESERKQISVKRSQSKNNSRSESMNRMDQTDGRPKSNLKTNSRYDKFPRVQQILTKKKSALEDPVIEGQSQQLRYTHNNIETSKREYRSTLSKINNKKSLVKMLAPEFDLKDSDTTRNLIISLKHLEKVIDHKVNKDVFLNVVEELEEKLESLRHSKDLSDTAEIKKFCMSIENRMQSVIAFIQQLQDDEDPIIAKKKWSCISCDRQTEKYTAKVGSHLNWDSLGGRKLSPVKAGAFGQTVMFASKVRNLINIGDIPE